MESAIGYVRVSTEEQAEEGVSLDAQEARIRAYCTAAGLALAGVIREEGVSGSIPLADRTGGADLLRQLEQGEVGHVVTLKLDRLFRDAEDCLHQTKFWDRAGVGLHLVDMGGQTLNTRSAMGRLFLTMTAAFAELERNLTRERTVAALAFKKQHNRAYSPTPYGFDRQGDDLIPDPAEREILRRIHQFRAQGKSYGGIARILNREGVPTSQGKRWWASTIRKLLHRPTEPTHNGA